jgi:DNA-binding SARP family transcriptional activator
LQFLVIHNNEFCPPEKIVESLWPDNEYVDEKKVLHTYMHRLKTIFRKENAVGEDLTDHIDVLNLNGSYMLKTSENVCFDGEELAAEAKTADFCSSREEILACLDRIFDIYKANFFEDSAHGMLVLRTRNRYLQSFCKTVGVLLEKLYALGCHEDIIVTAERLFNIDDMDENTNYWYIKSLFELGRGNHAVRHFAYIREKMQSVLAIAIPPRLTGLFGESAPVRVSDVETAVGAQFIDSAYIKVMINEMLNEKLAQDASKTQYTFVRVDMNNVPADVTDAMLSSAIVRSLRRNDMYAILDRETALIMLYNASEEYFDAIEARILSGVEDLYRDSGVNVSVRMWKAIRVV